MDSGQLPLASQACLIARCEQECWLLNTSKDQTALIQPWDGLCWSSDQDCLITLKLSAKPYSAIHQGLNEKLVRTFPSHCVRRNADWGGKHYVCSVPAFDTHSTTHLNIQMFDIQLQICMANIRMRMYMDRIQMWICWKLKDYIWKHIRMPNIMCFWMTFTIDDQSYL